jgi:hypothetical protein
VVQDGGQVIIGKPAADRHQPQGLIDLARADQRSEIDRAGRRGADPKRAGLDQPPGDALRPVAGALPQRGCVDAVGKYPAALSSM